MISSQDHISPAVPHTEAAIKSAPSTSKPSTPKFSFRQIAAPFLGFTALQPALYRWGMQDTMTLTRHSFDAYFQAYEIEMFMAEFFTSVGMQVVCSGGLGTLGTVTSVTVESVPVNVISLSFFDRLAEHGSILRDDGSIVKCLDQYTETVTVSDNLRKTLIMQESELYDVFSAAERDEFIFRVFKGLCLGGRVCQYEDDIKEYLDGTKGMYKDLVSVVKDSDGKLKVSSLVFKIITVDSSRSPLFPMDHEQNFCYASIDPLNRHLTLWYHASDSYYQ